MNALLRPAPGHWHRPMRASDIDAVLAIETVAYGHPWTRGNFIDSLAAGYLAELRLDGLGQLLGYYVALPGFEETHLLNLTVAPAWQRAGHGSAMLRRLQAWSTRRRDLALWLEVRRSNSGARALYQCFGFAEVGYRRDYYPADRLQREDALVLRLDLDPTAQGDGTPGGADALV
jgi:ribosomal-protein-alanine N-acetyltransferase